MTLRWITPCICLVTTLWLSGCASRKWQVCAFNDGTTMCGHAQDRSGAEVKAAMVSVSAGGQVAVWVQRVQREDKADKIRLPKAKGDGQ